MTAALPPEAAGKPVEIWFTDEARVGQQGTLTRVWAKRGSRPRARRDRRFEWAYLFGAICPERGTGGGAPPFLLWPGVCPMFARCQPEWHSGGNQPSRLRGRHRPAGARRRRLAQLAAGQGASEYRAVAVAALRARIEPDGKCLGVHARQLSQSLCLGRLRRHPRGMLRRLEQADANDRTHRLSHSHQARHLGKPP